MSVRNGRKSSTSIPSVARGSAWRAHNATATVLLWLTDPTAPAGNRGAPRGVESIGCGRLQADRDSAARSATLPPTHPARRASGSARANAVSTG